MSTDRPLRTLTQDELVAEATERFGTDRRTWAFKCPNCGDVATLMDFLHADAERTTAIGRECIGRYMGALTGAPTRGCDWIAVDGPWAVQLPSGKTLMGFELADKPA